MYRYDHRRQTFVVDSELGKTEPGAWEGISGFLLGAVISETAFFVAFWLWFLIVHGSSMILTQFHPLDWFAVLVLMPPAIFGGGIGFSIVRSKKRKAAHFALGWLLYFCLFLSAFYLLMFLTAAQD